MLIASVSFVAAGDNTTVSEVVGSSNHTYETVTASDVGEVYEVQAEPTLSDSNNVINVHVLDSYDESSKTWDEDGFDLAGATIKVYDSSNNIVKTFTSNSKGNIEIRNLNPGNYRLVAEYSTYEPIVNEINVVDGLNGQMEMQFIPDILLLVDYSSHNEKVDVLMEMSKRVAYISTTDFDKGRDWLLKYANYIQVDMFSEGFSNVFTAQYLAELLAMSPANANYKVAYTFGVYDERILSSTNMHIIGASKDSNTFHTIENTYIGSYFQAHDINESDVLQHNMENYLKYIYYLLNSTKYSNPLNDLSNAPQMSPECGFYHPEIGVMTVVPSSETINNWINTHPGYNDDGEGSLNWMTDEYEKWLVNELDPTKLFKDFEQEYISKLPVDNKFIAIVSYYYGGDVVDALIKGYAANGRPAFNIFKTGTKPAVSSILNKVNSASTVGISTVVSLYSWSLNYVNGSAESDLSQIDLDIIKGVNDISEYSYNSELGPQIEWTYSVTYPSFEGVFSPVILSYVDSNGKTVVIQSGIDKMVKLSCGWATLADLSNDDKKIAIVLYNYPPGKAEIGASYLDVFNSTYDLLIKLKEQGYDLGEGVEALMDRQTFTDYLFKMGNKGSWAQGLLEEYVENNWDYLMKHHQLISLDDFYDLTDDVPMDLIIEMVNEWGGGIGKVMVYKNKYIVIPGIWFGNVLVTFQPSRGWEEISKTIDNYHNTTLPPHQQYVAFYEWLDKTAGINAIINMGTHGTLEWLPGTNLGSKQGDWTFELTKTPTVYPYIVSNPGEAMVARDRIAALMITHMTPAMVSSELYGNYTILNNYINDYKDQIKLNVTSNAEVYKDRIIKMAPTLGFREIEDGENFTKYVDELHLYLEDLEDDFNTYGLHLLGKILTGYELIEEVITVTTSQTKIYDQILALLYPDLAGKSFGKEIQGDLDYILIADKVKEFLKEYITKLVNGSSIDDLSEEYGIAKNSGLYNSTKYAEGVIVNIQNNNEWNAILTALNGGYVKAGLFADPSYGDSIPTGYDGYASDSTRMPSEAAYESAVNIVDLLLANYYEQHGKWPELTSLILWGTEISRTQGIGVAEFLYFLGCKPVWAENGKVTGVEMIPLENLTVKLHNGAVVKRPRVDVFASIVTSNKDWLNWMLTAVKLAAFAEGENETNNFVKKHYAENPTLDRLFGLPGNMLEGTGMSNLIPNTADWNISTVNEYAASIYLNKVSYSWTIDEKGNIVITKQKDAFEYLLDNVDLITQNFDSTWRLFDSDDYYDWFGGLLNAAKILKHQSGKEDPDTAFVDIRNKNKYIARTYQEELEYEIRSIINNPQYWGALVSSPAGMNAWAARMQNMYATTILGGEKLNTQLGNQMADTALTINQGVDRATLAAGVQTSMAWMIYLANQGVWDADPAKVQELVDKYMQSVIDYGVACCHHTCKNLEWNAQIIQMSSLTPAQKQKYAEILAQATKTDPLYKMEDDKADGTNGNQGGNSGSQSEDGGETNSNQMVNGTTQNQESRQENGGQTAFGAEASVSGNAKSASQADSSASDSSTSSDNGDSKAYEIQEESTSKSVSATESSMPIFVIVAVIALIGIFLIGYIRDQDDNYDDY